MRKLTVLLGSALVSVLTVAMFASPAGARSAGLSEQRCTEILDSIQAVPFTRSGDVAIDEDFATAIAQREGVSVQAVQDCGARYNAGGLPSANPGYKAGELPDTGGPAPSPLLLGVLLAGFGALCFAAFGRRRV